jgi:exosortase
LQLLYLILAAFAFRGLLTFGSQADLSRELEEWFFVPTETSPLVVVLLASWLVYRRSPRLAALTSEPATWALSIPLLLVGIASFAWSTLTIAPHLLALAMLFAGLGIAGIHFGIKGVRIVLVPSLLLVFAVPVPAPLLAEIVYDFQIWTAQYAGWLLFLLGKSAYVSGDQILLADDHFAVIEGCSGLRSVQTLTMVALLLVELFGRRGGHALAILALAPLTAFALNGFRVLALILNPHSEVVAIHNLQGVVILLGGLVILYVVDGLLERFGAERAHDPLPTAGEQPPIDRARVGTVVAGLGAMCVLSLVLTSWEPAPPGGRLIDPDLITDHGDWIAGAGIVDPSFIGTIGYRHRFDVRFASRDEKAPADAFVLVGDLDQRYRSPISPKTVPPGSGWIVEQRGELERDASFGASWQVMRLGNLRVLIRHWYEGTEGMGSEILRGLLALDSSPWHRHSDVMVVRLTTEVVGATAGALDQAEARLDRFESALDADLNAIRVKARRTALPHAEEN